jgi:hypothetical protein
MDMILFDPDTHTYTVDGIVIPSVTTVCRFLSVDLKSDKPWLAQQAADRGTRIHAACCAIDYGCTVEDTEGIEGYLLAYRRFLKDYRPDWEGIEYLTGNLELGLAGTIDRWGTLYDGARVIVDIKTGATLRDAPLRGQLTGYKRLLSNDRVRFHAEKLYALHLKRDGTYTFRPVLQDDPLLDACLYIEKAIRRKPNVK